MKLFAIVLASGFFALTFPPNANSRENTRGRIIDSKGTVIAETTGDGLRSYPLAEKTAHLTGHVGKNDSKGMSGLEKACDSTLTQGKDISLTIDLRLQSIVCRHFPRDKDGAVVLIDPGSGAVLAIASFPAYNPNDFVPAISLSQWESYIDDQRRPLLNRAVHPAIPGSVYQIPSALAAELAGVGDTKYTCSGGVQIGHRYLKCWISNRPAGKHGQLGLSEAIKHSCNAWFYQLSMNAGIETFETTNRLLGLYDSTGCGLPEEKTGPSPVQIYKKRNLPITDGDIAILSIGQGTALASPIQIAALASTLANGGKRYQLHLLKQDHSPNVLTDLVQSGFTAEQISRVRKAMWRVVNDEDGSASHLRSETIALAGKTGTAQTGKPNRPHHAWFMGFAPFDHPELAIAVFVENGDSGSRVAGPIAQAILTEALSPTGE